MRQPLQGLIRGLPRTEGTRSPKSSADARLRPRAAITPKEAAPSYRRLTSLPTEQNICKVPDGSERFNRHTQQWGSHPWTDRPTDNWEPKSKRDPFDMPDSARGFEQ